MKNLKDYLEEKQLLEDAEQEQQFLLAEELSYIVEDEGGDKKQNHSQPHDPPAVLVMRRKSIRQFPNGQRVALYYVHKINKYVTVPYMAMQWAAMPEEKETKQKTVLEQLKSIVKQNEAKNIHFEDGKKLMVNETTAQIVLKAYNALNEENKKTLLEMSSKGINQFNKIVEFSRKHVTDKK